MPLGWDVRKRMHTNDTHVHARAHKHAHMHSNTHAGTRAHTPPHCTKLSIKDVVLCTCKISALLARRQALMVVLSTAGNVCCDMTASFLWSFGTETISPL